MPEQYKSEATTELKTFEGAVAIVTGAASGIGRAFAEELANKKVLAVVLVDRQRQLANEVASKINSNSSGTKTNVYEVDVRNFEDMNRVVTETVDAYGRLDYIFNNAGITVGGPIEDIGVDDFNYVLDVNVRGVANGVHAAYPVMKEQGFGRIVNTASVAGLVPCGEGFSAYGTAKFAVVGLSENLRIEAARHGVKVIVVCPGVINTPILKGGKFGKIGSKVSQDDLDKIWKSYHPMDPNKFAEKTLKLVAKNKPIIIVPGRPWKWTWLTNRLFPSLGLYLARKTSDKFVEFKNRNTED